MALTKRQEITLYSVLHVPYGQKVFRLVDSDPMLSKVENALLRWEANRRFGGSLDWLFHG